MIPPPAKIRALLQKQKKSAAKVEERATALRTSARLGNDLFCVYHLPSESNNSLGVEYCSLMQKVAMHQNNPRWSSFFFPTAVRRLYVHSDVLDAMGDFAVPAQ